MNYTFHPHAEKELEQIETHYDDVLTGLGDRFRDAVDLAISRIMMYPAGWQPLSRVHRRCRLNSFPYGIVYRVRQREIRILAITHDHRDPDYWKYRN
jgi:plasmid stabilization system protein ParE